MLCCKIKAGSYITKHLLELRTDTLKGKVSMVQNIGITGKSDLTVLKFIIEEKENAALSHSVMSDSMDCSPPGSSIHGDFPGKNNGVGCHALLQGNLSYQDQTQVSHIAGGFFTI